MGNKRKASLIVIVAIIAALAVFPFLLNNNIGPNDVPEMATAQNGSSLNCADSFSFKGDSGNVYAVIFAGQDGGGGEGNGCGAKCLAFYQSDGNWKTWTIGAGGGSGRYDACHCLGTSTAGAFYRRRQQRYVWNAVL